MSIFFAHLCVLFMCEENHFGMVIVNFDFRSGKLIKLGFKHNLIMPTYTFFRDTYHLFRNILFISHTKAGAL